MAYAVLKDTRVQAWELGAGTEKEKALILSGKLRACPDGTYEVFSRECAGGAGQRARAGDFIKADDEGFPWPNGREWFLRNHQLLEGDWYRQVSGPVKIWRKEDAVTEEIRFLLDSGRLRIHPEDPPRYFSAYLWETEETAASDAVIVFSGVKKDPEGRISEVLFNFVERGYFQKHYREMTP